MDEEYTLHEETAPGGYNTVTDFTFKVDNDNKVTLVSVETDGEVDLADDGSIVITDSRKETADVTVSKQDIAGEEIAGARIQILDKNGEVVEEWTSGSDGENEDGTLKPHTIVGKLYAGEEYTLHEEAGPEGYTTVSDIKFEIGEDNKAAITEATTDGEVDVADDGSIVELFDGYLLRGRGEGSDGKRKNAGRIPNVAGFCRFTHSTLSDFERLRNTRPEVHGALCAALEDEALNSEMSASILSVYLKLRLGYSGEEKNDVGITDTGQLRLIFDHDAYEDGG